MDRIGGSRVTGSRRGKRTGRWASRLLCALSAATLVGMALPPTAGAQMSDDASLAHLSVDSTVAQTKMTPAFHPDVTEYFVAAPSEGDTVTVNASPNHAGATLYWIGQDADPNLPGYQVAVTVGETARVSVRVEAEDQETVGEFYGIEVARASNQEMGWRVYDDVLVGDMVDDSRLPSHYLGGLWADDSRVLTTARRHVTTGLSDPNDPTSRPVIRLDRKLHAFNAADGSRRSSGEEFALGGAPNGGIWSDGATLWAMDFDGSLRAYSLVGGERETVEEYDNSVTVTALPLEGLGTDITPDGYYDTSVVEAPRGIWSDDETLWVVDHDNTKVFAFALPTECSRNDNYCRQATKDFDLSDGNDDPWGITAGRSSPTATEIDTFWVTDIRDRNIYAYGFDGTRKSELDIDLEQLDIINIQQYYYGLAATKTIMYVADFITSRIYSFSMPGVSGEIGPALVSSDASLSSLSLNNATLSPGTFDPVHTYYTAQVDNNVTSTTVTATPNHEAATYVVNGGTDPVIDLDAGTNTITVVVTAADSTTRRTYTVVVDRRAPDTDATLFSLDLTDVTLNPVFSPGTKEYIASVDNSVTFTAVSATPNSQYVHSAQVQLDGVAVPTGVVDLLEGTNVITVVVTAEDTGITETYKVTVTRNRLLSDVATLGDLVLGNVDLSPTFDENTHTYTATVANGVSETIVKYEKKDPFATVEIREGGAKSNGVVADEVVVADEDETTPPPTPPPTGTLVALEVDVNTVTVEVAAEDGVTMIAYVVTITRAEPSNVATLQSLSLDPGELSPAFSSGTGLYSAAVLHGDDSIDLTYTKSDGTATVVTKVGGTVGSDNTVSGGLPALHTSEASTNNSETVTVPMASADTYTVTFEVTAQDQTTMGLYVVTITRPVKPASNVATLGRLEITNPENSLEVQLHSTFLASDRYYESDPDIGNDVTKVEFVAEPSHPDATAQLKKGGADIGTPGSLETGQEVDLVEGANVFTIDVTAGDGNATLTYTVLLTRLARPLPGVATLDELVLKDVAQAELTLDPVFNRGDAPGQNPFETSVANGVNQVHVTASPTDAAAAADVMVGGTVGQDGMITGETAADENGFVPLSVGDNTVRIVVTAQDGTKKIYMVTVNRAVAPPSDDATLSSLTLDEATLNFMGDNTSYAVRVANGVVSATVRAIANSEAASLTVTLGSASAASDTDVKLTAPLAEGANVIEVVVTPEDQQEVTPEDQRTTKTYTVTVNRASPSPPPVITNPGTSNNGGGYVNPGGGSSTSGGGTEDDPSEDESDSSDSESDIGAPYTDAGDGGSAQGQAINILHDLGVLDGTECDDNQICPNDPLSRWVAAVWIVRVLDGEEPVAITESRFDDIDASTMWEESMWFAPHVERLAEMEVTIGCATDPLRYCPDGGLTRGQIASWIARAFDLPAAESAGFEDTAGSVHKDNIDSVVAEGIAGECSIEPYNYCPSRVVTRGEFAVFLDAAREAAADS